MQNIIILDTNNDKVIVQAQEKVYMDTINNFFVDYGKEIEYKSIDYNCGTESCWLNGVAFQQYPNEICEDILKSIDELIDKKAAREYIALTFDELKAIKLSEVDAWTERKIAGGFISECTGEIVRYDSDKDTQLTMQGIALNVSTERFKNEYPDGCPVRGYKDGETVKTIQYLNASQVYTWCADLSSHVGACKQQGWSKQAEVAAALSKEELDAIILD
ncbi:hypothetical protein GMD24_10590 [Phascolarctobacterium faecium]|uniref:DUF4376 domain-containing protein n=1 Tax=Phascolarctobacterium faecium TaxID=33025 RepID=A0A7X3BWC8_9FIRM|nr:DUF4376 domain-containing protein [Phascolarctobacterium faecium]KAA3380313.1 DUF4376 domain-containing protein [Akkermansia muciniphila]MTS25638.1 hypothetical protein [Sellimonas intestinalis]MTS81985.1 hypothetical protein [Phascolarctobacterium faecium]MTT03367.1 hypothetical protein [Phascolarctobacterium faecium]MTT17296.1 hypothetical protein [Phascolarctobacterium faecium]